MMAHPLITPPELHESRREVALFDIRWDLGDPAAGRERYLSGHIPGAVFVDLETDLCAPEGPGRHPLPDPGAFAVTLGGLGVGPSTPVVVYDDCGGGVAARLWWMLRAIGHRATVRLLDGGWQAWADAGYEVATGPVEPAPVRYPAPARGFAGTIDREGVRLAPGHLLLDGRRPERYRGETEPVDPRPGHIPGAVNLPWEANLEADGSLRDAGELRRRFQALGADRRPVVVACGSGVTACHLALAMELAGLPRPLLYPGSYSDWSRSDLPVVTGAQPA